MRRRLGIDMDGVVTNFTRGWVELYNAQFGATIRADEVVTWDAPTSLTHFGSMADFWSWASTCAAGKSVFRALDPYPGALEGLSSLVHAGHDLIIITTKPHFAIDDTYEWLEEHEVPAVEVHIVDVKHVIDCDLYIDDAPHNLNGYRIERPDAVTIRWVQPWNEPISGALDARTWPEVLDVANGLSPR